MKKAEITRIFLSPIVELSMIAGVFLLAYMLRGITDGIPFVQLRIPYIPYTQFIPFIISGVILWAIIFTSTGLYQLRDDTPIYEEVRMVMRSSFFWFIGYIGFVYLSTGFLFRGEIPRLIIFYTYIFSTLFSVTLRIIRHTLYSILYQKWYLEKNTIIVIYSKEEERYELESNHTAEYIYLSTSEREQIQGLIRERSVDGIISLAENTTTKAMREIMSLSRIYGVPFVYPKLLPGSEHLRRRETFFGDMPVIEITSVSISAWERITKRAIDIIWSLCGLIILFPLFVVIGIIIKLEDSSGPVFFANRRIGQSGQVFSLYKFRYMYWRYSVKDAYGIDGKKDSALKYEEKLKAKSDTRGWPLYKIVNDPRKMRFGAVIERLSLDELPQLWNVLKWDMSLVWPRPHQPREVDLYDEEDTQVLTVKPGITGMAQVYGREKNTFKDEILLDRHYIENYSLFLDIIIFIRTFMVVIERIWKK
jgi:exopolysaccharide biosynthesis polyprenyl glycosylphosphotransferase